MREIMSLVKYIVNLDAGIHQFLCSRCIYNCLVHLNEKSGLSHFKL